MPICYNNLSWFLEIIIPFLELAKFGPSRFFLNWDRVLQFLSEDTDVIKIDR